MRYTFTPHNLKTARRGFTLIELVASMASIGVLALGLASSVMIALESVDVDEGEVSETRAARDALEALHRDAQSALSFSELTATSVTMSVPDRDGDSLSEIIRYQWTGGAGGSFTRTYNLGDPTTLASSVESFSLGWVSRLMEGVSNRPIVLFVSSQAEIGGETTPSTGEAERITLMDEWGFEVDVISQANSPVSFNEFLEEANVVFVSGEVTAATLGAKLNAATIGVVTESLANSVTLKMLTSGNTTSTTTLTIADTSHYITEENTLGSLQVLTNGESLKIATGTTASGADVLATVSYSSNNYGSLIAVETGELLADGSTAPGRRAQLPWGASGMTFSRLNSVGKALMQRTIEWGAGAGAASSEAGGVVYENFAEAALASNSNALSISTPSSTAGGDLLVAAITLDGDAAIGMSAPSGWNMIHVGDNGGGGDCSIAVFWKIAGSSESTSQLFTWSASEQAYGWIMRFTGHDADSPINAFATAYDSSSTPVSPSVTTTEDNCLILRIAGFDDDDINVGDAGVNGHSTIAMGRSNTGLSTTSGGAAYVNQTTAGSSGTANFTLTGTEQSVGVTIAIAPAEED